MVPVGASPPVSNICLPICGAPCSCPNCGHSLAPMSPVSLDDEVGPNAFHSSARSRLWRTARGVSGCLISHTWQVDQLPPQGCVSPGRPVYAQRPHPHTFSLLQPHPIPIIQTTQPDDEEQQTSNLGIVCNLSSPAHGKGLGSFTRVNVPIQRTISESVDALLYGLPFSFFFCQLWPECSKWLLPPHSR